MGMDAALMMVIGLVLVATVWLIIMNQVTEEERDEMLRDEEMWP